MCVSNVISVVASNTVRELVSTPKHPALACRFRATSASRKLLNAQIEELADSLATRLIHNHPVNEDFFLRIYMYIYSSELCTRM